MSHLTPKLKQLLSNRRRAFELFDSGFNAYQINRDNKIPTVSRSTLDRWQREWKRDRFASQEVAA